MRPSALAGKRAEAEPDEELWDDVELGEWLREALISEWTEDRAPWAVSRVREIAGRLNAARVPARALEPVILWMPKLTGFILPGSYLYVTQGLLHRVPEKERIAFVIAHEMAHHDLGHTRLFTERVAWARRLPAGILVPLCLKLATRSINNPEWEEAADARALELCLRAAYDGALCLELFDVLQAHALDCGDIESAYGPEQPAEAPPEGWAALVSAGQTWLWERMRGYPSLHDRKAALQVQLRAQRR